ncbi:GIY-YIG nuclease family protein [Oceanihabitans sp. 2_MG-2023]|uniref:GIY-YIG nuclease family protein n=1 Tax=Oceanihabitans sp. 2_MG-2023 TaxID=3062661 RepID=UPI0026E19526|nr:GIY-YIG nuclease family protein [Oceanihabitans sp. 2_MG-2023]MDO6596092.1 GIY-YIG nuclease family protein [Oceanihabitans sp. 2_MG-2023]
MKLWYVYIMANKPNGVIYIGVTNNLGERVKEHKLKVYPKSFTARYNCENLVYFEEFVNGEKASIREIQFKKWKRDWKIKLIEEMNPSWADLSLNWNLGNKIFRNNN